MSYGGSDGERSPGRIEISDVRSWDGPSAAERDLDAMWAMLQPVDEALRTRTNPDEQSPGDQVLLLDNSIWVLQRLGLCLELFIEQPVDRPVSFAEMTYLAANSLREEFKGHLDAGNIDQRQYERVRHSLARAAHDICNAFDFASLVHNVPRQREGTGDTPALGEIALGPPASAAEGPSPADDSDLS